LLFCGDALAANGAKKRESEHWIALFVFIREIRGKVLGGDFPLLIFW